MKKTVFLTLGCKLNQVETDHLMERLSQQGVAVPVKKGDSDTEMVVINTCAVTEKAAAKSRHLIAEAHRLYPNAEIIAAGCLAQLAPSVMAGLEGVHCVVGTSARWNTEWWKVESDTPSIFVDPNPSNVPVFSTTGSVNHSRPRLKIQDGCDQCCTYCIIPTLRGKPRSVELGKVMVYAQELIRLGALEIVLTGVRIGSYGADLVDVIGLPELINQLTQLNDITRWRLGSVEPWELDQTLVDIVLDNPQVCRHFHIPLQHTETTVLNRMGRPPLDDTLNLLKRAYTRCSELAVGIDLIVGFPGETESDFNRMLETVAQLPLAYIHQFRFSPRPGTPAEHYTDVITTQEMKHRAERLHSVNLAKREWFALKNRGSRLIAIPDNPRQGAQYVQAITDNYLRLKIPVKQTTTGKAITVRVESDSTGELIGLVE